MDQEKIPPLRADYNENVLVLLVQNPNVIFAYLEMSDHFWGALVGHGQPVLRLYDVTGGASSSAEPVTEVDLPPFTANWYFHSLTPGRTYAGELGWRDRQGLFVSLLRSNPAATPANERAWTEGRKKMGLVTERSTAAPWHRKDDAEEADKEDALELPTSYPS